MDYEPVYDGEMDHDGHVIGLVLHGAEAAWECRS